MLVEGYVAYVQKVGFSFECDSREPLAGLQKELPGHRPLTGMAFQVVQYHLQQLHDGDDPITCSINVQNIEDKILQTELEDHDTGKHRWAATACPPALTHMCCLLTFFCFAILLRGFTVS